MYAATHRHLHKQARLIILPSTLTCLWIKMLNSLTGLFRPCHKLEQHSYCRTAVGKWLDKQSLNLWQSWPKNQVVSQKLRDNKYLFRYGDGTVMRRILMSLCNRKNLSQGVVVNIWRKCLTKLWCFRWVVGGVVRQPKLLVFYKSNIYQWAHQTPWCSRW